MAKGQKARGWDLKEVEKVVIKKEDFSLGKGC